MSDDDLPSRREKDGCHDDDDVPPPPSSSSSSPWQDTWPPAALAMAKQALLLTSQGWPLTGQDQDAFDEPGATVHHQHRRPRDVTAIDVSDVLGPSYSPSTVRHPSIAQSGLAAATVEIAERMVSLLLMRIVALVTWRLEREEEEEEEEVEDGEHEGENDKDAADEKKQPMQQKQQRRRRKRKKRMYSDLSTTTIAKTALLGHACSSHSHNDDNEDSNNNNNNNNSVNYDDRETMLSPLPRHSSEPGFLASNIFPSTISFQTDSSHSNNNPSNPSDDPLTLRRPPPKKTRQPPRWPTRITPLLVSQLRQYVLVICENYRTVPYHNVEHAYHVFLSANKLLDLLLSEGGKKGGDAPTNTGRRAGPTFGIKSDPLAQLAFLFSALVHDVDHRGISNRQLVLESDDLAILYNDQSVAEQRSLAVAFAVWMMPEYGVLRGVLFDEEKKGQEEKEGKGGMKTEKKNNNNNNNREEHFKFRKLVIDLVLVTDIASPERTQIVKSKWKEAFGEIILTANLNHRKGTRRGGSGGVGGNDRGRDKERNREKETEIRKERERNEGQIERRREHGEVDAAKTATANTTANTTAAEAAALVAAEFFASSEDGIPSESNPGGSHRPVSAPGAAASSSEHGSQTHNRKGGAMAVPMAVPATATATTTATSTTQVIQKHSNASNNIKRGGMPSSSSSSSSSTGRGGGGAMQKQGSFTRRGRGMPMPKQLQKQGSIKNLELMSTLDEDDDGDDDDELSVKSFDDLDLGARAAKYLNGNHDNISNNNNNGSNNDNCNINTLKSKWMPSKQPPPQRGISRRHSLSSKIGMPSATERKKKRRPRPESQPLRNSFLSVADSVADSVIESVLHSVDLSSGSSYSSEEGEYSLEDQFDTSFVSRQKMNFDDDGGGMSIDSRAFSIVCCNDDGDNDDDDDDHHDDVDNDRDDSDVNDDIPPRSSPPSIPPKDTSDDTIPTNVRLNPTPPMTSISTEETPINKRTGPRLIQSLSAGNLEAMMDDHPSDSPADKFRPTFRPPRLTPNRHDRRNTDEGPRPSLRRPPNRHRFLSRSMISPGEFKRSTPRAHSQERRLGVRRALDLAGSTIEAFKSSYQSGHSSDMEYLLDDDPDEVDELKATVVLEQMMRAADVAALLQDWENVMKWSTRLYKELKNGYLAERGEDPSVGWFDNQIKFFDFYILPLAKNLGLTGVFEEEVADCFVQCVKNNLARWIEEGERETDLMMKLDEQERRNSAEGERISSHGSCEDDAGHSKDGRTIRRSSQADEYIASDLASSMYSLNSGLANSVHNNSGDLEADIALYSASSADKKHSARNAVNGGDKNS